jgi:hypothetical protein
MMTAVLEGTGSGRANYPARPAQEAEPSQLCGAAAQHQPSRGRPLLTHKAGTRRSPHREASIEKQFRVLRMPGKCVTSASPSSIVIGDRPAMAIRVSASSGTTSRAGTKRSADLVGPAAVVPVEPELSGAGTSQQSPSFVTGRCQVGARAFSS